MRLLKMNATQCQALFIKYENITVLALVLVSLLLIFTLEKKAQDYTIERKFRYSFILQNKTNQLLNNVDFWVYAPVAETSNQKVINISASHEYELLSDKLGNQVLHFTFSKFAPFASKVIKLETDLLLSEMPVNKKLAFKKEFIAAEKYVEANHPKISQIAQQFTDATEITNARNALEWVHQNVKYAGYIEDDRGALYALKTRKGDCTEYMYLYTALMRNKGIPVRNIGGYVYNEDKVLKAEDFHNWSEVYLDGKWQVVDPQNGIFLEKQNHYVAFRIITNKVASKLAPSNTQRFAISNPDISVKMN